MGRGGAQDGAVPPGAIPHPALAFVTQRGLPIGFPNSKNPSMPATPSELVARCQIVLAHAWMVRTFVKHSDEVEAFPELMGIVRGVFDLSRAVEPRVGDPVEYFKMLDKKMSDLRKAAEQFAIDAPHASTHTTFAQAVISIRASVEELEGLLAEGLRQTTTVKAPPSIKKPGT